MMPSFSTCDPPMKPGTSPRYTSGTLNASHMRMNRAALSAESESSTPPFCIGWFATTPTEFPAGRGAPAHIVFGPSRLALDPRPLVKHNLDHLAHVVRGARADRHDLVQPRDKPVGGIADVDEGRRLEIARGQVGEEAPHHVDALLVVSNLVVPHP